MIQSDNICITEAAIVTMVTSQIKIWHENKKTDEFIKYIILTKIKLASGV